MSTDAPVSFRDLVQAAEHDPDTFRAAAPKVRLAAIRNHYRSEWKRIEAAHLARGSGRGIVAQLTALADDLVRGVLRLALAEVGASARLRKRIAACALGGYGRGELNPHSDLDVCLLYTGRLDSELKALNTYLVPLFWDVGFKSGYVLQEVKEAARLAATEQTALTSYLHARFLAGDPAVFARFERALEPVVSKQRAALLAFLRERADTGPGAGVGRDLYEPEPDLKEGVGGLRDYHTALWILHLTRGGLSLDDLEHLGELAPEDNLLFQESLDFIWRIRNELHFHTGKGENQLTFVLQKHVALALGYGEDARQAIDRLMQDYYTAARAIRRLLRMVVGITNPMPSGSAARETTPRGRIDVVRGELWIGNHDPQWFAENPPRLMEVIWESGRRNAPLSHKSQVAVTRNLGLVDAAFRGNDLVRRFFTAICGRPLQAGLALRQAAETGLLGAYIPEFAEVDGVVRYEDFHSYPVHEHTLRAIEAVGAIPGLEGATGRLLQTALEHLRDPHVLILAILMHDLGKAGGEEHVEEGVRLARGICGRMGLPEEDTDRIVFLVEHHMLMNHIAMYRDTDDLDIVSNFAATVRTADRLRALLLLSYADLSAVGPDVWTEWKGALLGKLYLKTERILLGRPVAAEAYWTLPKARAVAEATPAPLRSEVVPHLVQMGERYFVAFSPEQIADHLRCIAEARIHGLAVLGVENEGTRTTDIVVCTQNSHGLFSRIAGSFASQLLDVQRALVFTAPDGYIVDRFTVTDAVNRRPLTERQFEALKQVLFHVLLERGSVQEYVNKSRTRLFALHQPRVPVATRISFDNECSKTDTVVEIETGDRTGLLYDIACVFAGHGIDFFSSHVVTDARQVRDSFYVRLDGSKITDPAVQAAVRAGLETAIRPLAVAGG
ncbi:MAG: [protein-PII] uridylyltransferase [Candidatus Hydrogenedentes bacterium]|nr:[protein-PII] uridylyltransferase [Candidatus Hydrogenedentota bacterium]